MSPAPKKRAAKSGRREGLETFSTIAGARGESGNRWDNADNPSDAAVEGLATAPAAPTRPFKMARRPKPSSVATAETVKKLPHADTYTNKK